MNFKNTTVSYGSLSKFFHWIIAFSIVILLTMGFMLGAFNSEPLNDLFYLLHKSIGFIVLVLMLSRLFWRFINPKPDLGHLPMWEQQSARLTHNLFYLILLVMPLSGWVMSVAGGYTPTFFNLFTLPLPISKSQMLAEMGSSIHKFLAWVIIGLISLHILAALKHYFLNKDDVLQRMLPFKRNPQIKTF